MTSFEDRFSPAAAWAEARALFGQVERGVGFCDIDQPVIGRSMKTTERARHVASQARSTFVITNNHFQGKAVVNALELNNLLTGAEVDVPGPFGITTWS